MVGGHGQFEHSCFVRPREFHTYSCTRNDCQLRLAAEALPAECPAHLLGDHLGAYQVGPSIAISSASPRRTARFASLSQGPTGRPSARACSCSAWLLPHTAATAPGESSQETGREISCLPGSGAPALPTNRRQPRATTVWRCRASGSRRRSAARLRVVPRQERACPARRRRRARAGDGGRVSTGRRLVAFRSEVRRVPDDAYPRAGPRAPNQQGWA